jgi:hypothetical protein
MVKFRKPPKRQMRSDEGFWWICVLGWSLIEQISLWLRVLQECYRIEPGKMRATENYTLFRHFFN